MTNSHSQDSTADSGSRRLQPADGSPVFQGERVAFTGTLASVTHDDACRMVEELGGESMRHVSKQTTMLVVGQEGWPLEADGQPSQKLIQAETLNSGGQTIRIVAESDWLQLCGHTDPQRHEVQDCTPAMLSTRLNLPVSLIRRWERIGLIQPVRRVFRLPYFDFQEVKNARRLSELLENGASPDNLEAALCRIGRFTAESERSVTQLNILVHDKQIVLRDDAGLLNPATGQRLLDFHEDHAGPDARESAAQDDHIVALSAHNQNEQKRESRNAWTSARWYQEGCRLADNGRIQDSIEAFRLSLSSSNTDESTSKNPHAAEVNFSLAEALYRQGKPHAAVERYYCATEFDPLYVEAWTQLGCLLLELEQHTDAIHAFRIALDVHADYVDVHWHLAAALTEYGDVEGAHFHCHEYLAREQHGPWADRARQILDM